MQLSMRRSSLIRVSIPAGAEAMEVLHQWHIMEGPRVHALAIDKDIRRDGHASNPGKGPLTEDYTTIEVGVCLLLVRPRVLHPRSLQQCPDEKRVLGLQP